MSDKISELNASVEIRVWNHKYALEQCVKNGYAADYDVLYRDNLVSFHSYLDCDARFYQDRMRSLQENSPATDQADYSALDDGRKVLNDHYTKCRASGHGDFVDSIKEEVRRSKEYFAKSINKFRSAYHAMRNGKF